MPDVLSKIIKAFNACDFIEVEKQQELFTDFGTDLYALGYAPAMDKRALFIQDHSVGENRQPANIPEAEQDKKIINLIKEYNLL